LFKLHNFQKISVGGRKKMTPKIDVTEIRIDAPEDFSEIMELTQEEKRELLNIWYSFKTMKNVEPP
jgi:hypothetical protein